MQAAPGSFESLEVFVMNDEIDLLRKFSVDFGNDCFNRAYRVLCDQLGAGKRLLGQCFDCGLYCFLCSITLGLELLVKKVFELIDLGRCCCRCSDLSLWI